MRGNLRGLRWFDGKLDDERGATQRAILRPDLSSQLRHDALTQGKPQACAFGPVFGGEVRVEDPGLQVGFDPGAGIRDPDADVIGRRGGVEDYVAQAIAERGRFDAPSPREGLFEEGVERETGDELVDGLDEASEAEDLLQRMFEAGKIEEYRLTDPASIDWAREQVRKSK